MDVAQAEPPTKVAHAKRMERSLHIAIVGPIASEDIARLLPTPQPNLPLGYSGAPFLTTLIEELIACGHRVSAFTLSGDLAMGTAPVVCNGGPKLQVHYCPMRPRAWQPNGRLPGRITDLYRHERQSLQQAMLRSAPDLVHAHWAYEFAWAAQSTGLPALITSHDSPFAVARFYKGFVLGGYRRLRALMAWRVLRRARWVSTVSPYMQQQLQGLCTVPVDVVPNPISPQIANAKRCDAPRRLRVLMVCNGWSAIKNPEPALRGLSLLAGRMPEIELVLLGQSFGPGEAASQWWAANGLQAQVRFIGAVPYPEVIHWMCRSDVLLHPSLEESFGMVLAEAMATGLAVVAGRDSGAVPWVLAGCGRLVDVRSPQAISEALFELLNDPGLRATLTSAARSSVTSRFSSAAVAEQYLKLYRRALVDVPLAKS